MQINKIRNKKRNITTDTEDIQRLVRTYFKNLYPTKLENLKEMDNFLDRYHIPKLNHNQTNNFRPITPSETKEIIKSLTTTKDAARA